MHTQLARLAARTTGAFLYQVALLLVFTGPVPAQQSQPAAPPSAPPATGSFQSYLPALPPSVVPPRIVAPHPCNFPHTALYDHPTGPAVVKFTVTAKGEVTNPSIAQSSGSGRVDEAAHACVSEWVYAPALRDGVPVDQDWATEISLTITTRNAQPALPPDAPQGTKLVIMPVRKYRATIVGGCEQWHRDSPRGVLVAFDVEPDGSVKNAAVAESSGNPAVDKDAVDCVSQRTYKPTTRDGEPVEIRLTSELFANN